MSIKKISKGFTLIESIIYLALFVIVIGGGMVATYQVIQATDATNNHVILQGEANFLFRKIDWALNGADSVNVPSPATLIIQKPSLQLTFSLDGSNLTLERGSSGSIILNSSSITVDSVTFERIQETGKPDSINADFTLTTSQVGKPASQSFSSTKYLR